MAATLFLGPKGASRKRRSIKAKSDLQVRISLFRRGSLGFFRMGGWGDGEEARATNMLGDWGRKW